MNNEVNPLGQERVSRLLFKFSLPAIVGMVVNFIQCRRQNLYWQLCGTLWNSGITIGFPIMIILMSMGLLFGVGGHPLFHKIGGGKGRGG